MTSFKKFFGPANAGFTLVELLIVIAILGVIVIIVVAALNPIEQLNRSRDTSYRKSAGDIVTANERYFAGRSEYPWVTLKVVANNAASIGYSNANLAQFGICAADAACPDAGGPLVTTNELKTEFMNRDFLKSAAVGNNDAIMVGKATGTNSSVYACYVPKSKSAQDKACAESKVFTLAVDGTRTLVDPATCTGAASWDSSWNVCVPE